MTISQGRASTVTDRGDGTVLRVGGRPAAEARIMELARSHGVRVPRVHEVRSDALVLERIEGPTMGAHLTRRPWLTRSHVRTLVELHAAIHAIPFEGARLVHFDLHPDNVLLSPAGPVLIDWTNAHGADPEADLALTWIIMATSAGWPGRLLARLFAARVGHEQITRGLAGAREFRLADPNVTDAERRHVRSAAP